MTWTAIAAAVGAVTPLVAAGIVVRFAWQLLTYGLREADEDDPRPPHGDWPKAPRTLTDEEIDAEWDKHYGTRSL